MEASNFKIYKHQNMHFYTHKQAKKTHWMNQSVLGNHEKNRQGAPELSWYCPGGQGDGNKKPGPCGTGKLQDPMKGGCSCSYSHTK